MSAKKKFSVVAAWAERAAGPGWANSIVWVLLRDGDQNLSLECLQPEEHDDDLRLLFPISVQVHNVMSGAAEDALRKLGRM